MSCRILLSFKRLAFYLSHHEQKTPECSQEYLALDPSEYVTDMSQRSALICFDTESENIKDALCVQTLQLNVHLFISAVSGIGFADSCSSSI